MDTRALLFATLAGVTCHAWRPGSEKRDVALFGALSGLCGVRTAVTIIL